MNKKKLYKIAGILTLAACLFGFFMLRKGQDQTEVAAEPPAPSKATESLDKKGVEALIQDIDNVTAGIVEPKSHDELALENVNVAEKKAYEEKLSKVQKIRTQFTQISEQRDALIQSGKEDSAEFQKISEQLEKMEKELVAANEALLESYKTYSEAYIKAAMDIIKSEG